MVFLFHKWDMQFKLKQTLSRPDPGAVKPRVVDGRISANDSTETGSFRNEGLGSTPWKIRGTQEWRFG